MRRGDPHKTITIIRQPSQANIPRLERREQRKKPAGLDNRLIGRRGAVAVDVSDAEQQEGDVDGDEDAAEDEGGFQGAENEEEGEDEPTLHLLIYGYWLIEWCKRGAGGLP